MTKNKATIVAIFMMPVVLPAFIVGFIYQWAENGFRAGAEKANNIGLDQKQ